VKSKISSKEHRKRCENLSRMVPNSEHAWESRDELHAGWCYLEMIYEGINNMNHDFKGSC
jgi:hypothetical protein